MISFIHYLDEIVIIYQKYILGLNMKTLDLETKLFIALAIGLILLTSFLV